LLKWQYVLLRKRSEPHVICYVFNNLVRLLQAPEIQLADLGVTFEEINIEEVPGTAEIVEKVNGGNRTVPTLVFSDGAAMTNPSAKQVVEKLAELA